MSEERDESQAPRGGRGEQEIKEQTTELSQEGDRMEGRLEELGDDIKDAKRTAAQRQDAPDEPVGEVAGDWEGESVGADHGDDATDDVDGEDGGNAGLGGRVSLAGVRQGAKPRARRLQRVTTVRRGIGRIERHGPGGDEPHGLGQQRVLERAQAVVQRVGVRRVADLERALQDDRARCRRPRRRSARSRR
jgi:hypothetical protein